MPDQHALITASGAHRWMHCTPSARLEADLPDSTSEAAKEGTIAHALAEKKLRAWIKSGKRVAYKAPDASMGEYTDDYRDYVIGIVNDLAAAGLNPQLKVEVQLDLSSWIPEGFGTSDAVIISDDVLHVIDFKYGKNVKVDAPENPQMRLYALGALDLYGEIFEFDTVVTHIVQPRCEGGHISMEKISVKDLISWGEAIKPLAQAAWDGKGDQKPGPWCMFCRAKTLCKARAKEMFGAIYHKPPVQLLDLDGVAEYLPYLDEAIKWAQDLQSYAFDRALKGDHIPGYKLVEGRSNRVITDPDDLVKRLKDDGLSDDQIYKPQQMQSLTNLEKVVGKKKFGIDYGDLITKPKGKPTLVPESDKREPMDLEALKAEMMFGKQEEK